MSITNPIHAAAVAHLAAALSRPDARACPEGLLRWTLASDIPAAPPIKAALLGGLLCCKADLGPALAPAPLIPRRAPSAARRAGSAASRRSAPSASTAHATPAPPDPWDLLQAHAALPSLVKFGADPAGRLALQAELPIGGSPDWGPRLANLRRGFARGLEIYRAGPVTPSAETHAPVEKPVCPPAGTPTAAGAPGSDPAETGAGCDALIALGAETEWPFAPQGPNRCAVPLETRRRGQTATVNTDGLQVHFSNELAVLETLSPVGREAVGRCLLLANGLVRLARLVLLPVDKGWSVQLEAVFDQFPTGREADDALCALSVGSDVVAGPLELLPEPAAAEAFLSVRGGPRDAERQQRERTI
ncbi:MAG: hypothetical protein JXQ71_12865 [Verrucomicrobia bacterium]|nr:hypothetical protein [Verrucomicrobiota bacterium]